MQKIVRSVGPAGLIILTLAGCDPSGSPDLADAASGPARGAEQGPCLPNATCSPGLVCLNQRCVREVADSGSTPVDAGISRDGDATTLPDAAERSDSGPIPEAGVAADGGSSPDAGSPLDAATATDAGPADGGPADAGPTDLGCAASFSLLDPRVETRLPADTALSADATIEFWMRRDGAGPGTSPYYEIWFDGRFLGNPINLRISYIKATGQGYSQNDFSVWLAGTELRANIPLSDWTHVAAVRASGTCRLFVGGQSVAQAACAPTSPLYIDTLSVGFEALFAAEYGVHGAIDEVRISNVARYSNGFTPRLRLARDANTLVLWHFDEGAGLTVADASANGNDGAIAEGTWIAGAPFCPECGNGTVESPEQCDDGNVTTEPCAYGQLSCSVCDSTCRTVAGQTSYCGDGRLSAARGEQCDDANTVTEPCPYGQLSCTVCAANCASVAGATSYCGNGRTEGAQGETCDDGNATTEPCAYGQLGCSVCDSTCRTVAGRTSYCGDGRLNSARGEQCDDGNTATEPCSYGRMSCTVCNSTCASAAGATRYCGDGNIDTGNGEQCDDRNDVSGDGCSATCQNEDCRTTLVFDGSTSLVRIPDTLPAMASWTAEGWFQGAQVSGIGALIQTRCGTLAWRSNGFFVQTFPSCTGTGTRFWLDNITAAFPSGWFHLALVVTNQPIPTPPTVSIYVNGVQVAAPTLQYDNGVASTTSGSLGANRRNNLAGGATAHQYAAVRMATVRVSNSARYSATFTPAFPLSADANSVLLYRMDEGSGTTLTDSSGAGRSGSVSNATWSCDWQAPSETSGCADGTTELGSTGWGRSDIAFCQLAGSPSVALRPSQGAAAYCAAAWHICTSAEFTARNDNLDSAALAFGGTLDDGNNCFAMNLPSTPLFSANLDTVRSGFAGSCTGTQSASAWGRQELPACGPSGAGACGVLCCR